MGCCQSKGADVRVNRVARWRSTGIVALRDAKLKTFPDEVLDLDRTVRTLDLTNNKLVDIPMEISKLINMQRLILAGNLIERLPINLGKLQSLKIMTLDGNQITSLPDELGQLVRLEQLSISGNMLTSLPETIGSLRNLSLLNVSNNKLKSLPESIGSCFSLEEIQANGIKFSEDSGLSGWISFDEILLSTYKDLRCFRTVVLNGALLLSIISKTMIRWGPLS
ncbi:hypothetical protein SLEP1_g43802 [Rubroshorea leprosula]|uniref:Disease resistance R13L4/SHOC-2-like LRR domain-containing protein n=1 Tax=Rubroshorea leprosula TaxID=152421 RepID=A0AAV5LE72_9ROSI|nr:hypothetical protein SLEP1_g43802 [Rubroshorea leprosula]